MISKRISKISCNEETFNKAAPFYNKSLQGSGYTENFTRQISDPINESKTKTRKRKIIWFNPPFSEDVETNIGREFLRLVDKHFSKHHRLHKICNHQNIKISYCCISNMHAIISAHNKRLLSKEQRPPEMSGLCFSKTLNPIN